MKEESERLINHANKEVSWSNTCCIKDLVPAKLCYLFQYAFIGTIVPYFTIYFFSVGLTVSQVGCINGLRTIFPFFFGPLFGMLADKTGRTKLIVQILVVLKVTGFFIAPWLFAPFAVPQTLSTTNITNATINAETKTEPFHYSLFFVAFAWGSFIATVGFPLVAFVDQCAMLVVKKHETRASYGMQRIFAPMGYAVTSFLSGIAIDLYSKHPFITKYNVVFYFSFPFGVFFFVSATLLPTPAKAEEEKEKKRLLRSEVLELMKNVEFTFFLITATVLGIGYALIKGFFLFLMEEIHAPKTVMGGVVAVASLSEVMIYPFCSKIKKLIGGNYPCFIAAVFSFSLRFFLYSFMKNYWLAIPIQMLQAIGFALFWAAAVEYTYEAAAPKNIGATVFNIVVLLYHCFATIVSNIGGGILYECLGGRVLFQIMGSLCGIWGIILVLFYMRNRIFFKRKDHQPEEYIAFT